MEKRDGRALAAARWDLAMKWLLLIGLVCLTLGWLILATARAQTCAGVGPSPESVDGAQSYVYRHASNRDLRIHLFSPTGAGPHPAILFFFGGGWSRGEVTQFADQARAAQRAGYVAALADYRVACRDRSTLADAASDAAAAYEWLVAKAPEFGVDPKRIVLSGGSSGGELAATTAMRAPPGEAPLALVLFNPVLDLSPYAGRPRLPVAVARAISPAGLPMSALPPTIIFHGTADRTVPIQSVRDFCAEARSAGRVCQLQEYPGMGHGFFGSRMVDPVTQSSPYDDTLTKSLGFLNRIGSRGGVQPHP